VVDAHPGLYFVGLPFQRTLSSVLVGGVGRDADHIAGQIASRRPAGATDAAGAASRAS
jgi:putative flavoprotein involved in K+ transport